MNQVLVVEDSRLFGSLLKKKIDKELGLEVVWVQTFKEAAELINSGSSDFLVGLLDLNLPDAPDGKIVDYVLSKGIPAIVFTGDFSDQVREGIWAKKVVDYVIKESNHTLDYVVSVIKRINQNRTVNVLVVDDSILFRTRIRDLLRVHMYNVIEAGNGVEAMKIINSGTADIRMVITDFNMPQMDGFQLIDEIRKKYTKEQIAIIGMSGNNTLSARFIKHGANDFINKEFFSEEFYCRITQNIEMLDYINMIKEASNTDYLTGLYNRRYFFEVGTKLFANAKRDHMALCISMIDIDYFKKINDTYGHDAGDLVLQKLALILKSRFRESDIVCRFGGEEFCILMCNMNSANSQNIFEELRQKIENIEINLGEETIKMTVSIGICSKLMSSIDEMIKMADAMLYQAKEEGRNRIKSIG